MATIDGSIQLVKVVTDAELRQNGGSFVVAGRMAQPIQGFDTLTKRASGGNAIPVYVVSDAQIADGTFRLKGGSALPMADIDVVSAGVKTIQGAAIPVYVVSGSLAGAGGAPAVPTATYTVTTVGAATHTISSFGVAAGETVTIDWGDGNSDDYTGTALRTHDYAGAGDWMVTIYTPEHVRTFSMQDNKVTLNSADIATMSNVTSAVFTGLKAGTFNSSDIAAWNPSIFQLYSMPAGYAGTFNSADVVAWNPATFLLLLMPAGYAGTFNSADVVAWNPGTFRLRSMPAGYAITITANAFVGFTVCNNFEMQGNGLLQADVNTLLYDLYQASIAPRTATNGSINVGGSNAAPSGTLQPAAACPVTSSTPGKEVAYELVNDSCLAFANHWSTVTITA